MSDDEINMQIRKFLKRVGVESHEAIAKAVDAADGKPVRIRMALTIGTGSEPEKNFEATIGVN
jgi:hypothetical protein